MRKYKTLERAQRLTGLTTRKLADFLGVNEGTLFRWEINNSKSVDQWPKWALEKCGFKIKGGEK